MRDYFGALVSRVLQPERGVQPRRRVPFEAVAPPTLDAPEPFDRDSDPAADPTGGRRSAAEDVAPVMRKTRVGRGPQEQVPAPTIRAISSSLPAKAPGGADDARVVFEPHPTVAERRIVGETPGPEAAHATQQGLPAVGPQRLTLASMSHPDVRQRLEPPRDTAARVADASADPVIRIHIGRIDVRAITTGAPAPPTRAREQRRGLITLDEYVQRGGRS